MGCIEEVGELGLDLHAPALGDLTVSVTRKISRNGITLHCDFYGTPIIAEVYSFLEKGWKQENTVELIKRWITARRTFQTLIEMNFPYQPQVRLIDEFLDTVDRMLLRALVRKLLLGNEGEAKECLKILSEGIERGRWPGYWDEEWQAEEDRVCADVQQGRACQKTG
jgi:hypothetical protein